MTDVRSRAVGVRTRSTEVLFLLLVVVSPIASADEPSGSVEIVAPRYLSTVLGPTTIELRCHAGSGASIERVELKVDGEPLATLTEPPWRVGWDAGDGSRGHSITAVLFLSDGTYDRAAVRTSPLRINQVEEVGLVSLYPVVKRPDGSYVKDLQREDFEILEDGVTQSIERFSTQGKPLRIALVLDTSLSMSKGSKLHSAQKAALEFLQLLDEGDEAMVVTFSDAVHVVQPPTSDTQALELAIKDTEAGGGTALYDAIWRTSHKLVNYDGRRVLVLLSDGRDEAANGFEPGSLHTIDEALDKALRSDVMVFSIGLGRHLEEEYARQWSRAVGSGSGLDAQSLEQILNKLAETTGGRLMITPRAGQLRSAFNEVAEDLRHQYSIAYTSTNADRRGEWRDIELRTPGKDLEVVTRRGYYASPPRSAADAAASGAN